MQMDDIKLFAKNEKESKSLIQIIRIYIQEIRMEFGIEECSILIIKSGKRKKMKGIELPNQERIRMLGEKKNYKYFGMMKANTIKQRWKKKNKKSASQKNEKTPWN